MDNANSNSMEILNGNELIVEGALEAGFHLFTGYPGSPLADYFNILYQKKKELKDLGIRAFIANSEANAAAMASGAKQAGKNALVVMKSMGLHVAADALSVGNFANPGTGGVVVVVGDDPWSLSTSSPADSRYLFKHLHIPFLEPSTPAELKEWVKVALQISQKTSVYQGLLLTTFMAEGGGRIEKKEVKKIDDELINLDPSSFDLTKNVMVPPNSLLADEAMIKERFPKVLEVLNEMDLDLIYGNRKSKVGFICSGGTFEVLREIFDEHDGLEEFSLYKVAAPYPLIAEKLVPYMKELSILIVVEEKRGFLETELQELAGRFQLDLTIWGKKINGKEGFPAHGGLSYEILLKNINLIREHLQLSPWAELSPGCTLSFATPKRLPTFCPGCPHRETLSLLKELRKKLKKKQINLITHGDVGCYSLSFLEPFKEMHNLSAMGQGGALGVGLDTFTVNPSVVLMGDSTFFHSGVTDISNSVQADHDITYILLDNDNTAMTGHQFSPSSGESVEGFKRPAQDMYKIVTAIGVKEAYEVNPSDRYFYQNLLEDIILKPGTKVIVSNKECGLTFHSRRKKAEQLLFNKGEVLPLKKFYQINTDACEDCRMCVEMTGCPGLSQTHDAYGTKLRIDPQICVGDSYCTKIKVCPSFELVEVLDYHPDLYRKKEEQSAFNIQVEPQVKKTLERIAEGEDFRIVVTGVGGSGVTTIARVLAEASRSMEGREDIDFKFVDQKGLAQRNGNVTSHLVLFKKGKSASPVTPLGSADVLLSADLLDGTHHLKFLSPQGHLITDQSFQVPLSIMLDRGEISEPVSEETIKKELLNLLGERAKCLPIKELCVSRLGKNIYSSAMILGVAFQAGLLPFSKEALLNALIKVIKNHESENNKLAFHLGRALSINHVSLPEQHVLEHEEEILKQSVQESFLFNAKKMSRLFENGLSELRLLCPEINAADLARYIHDIIVYDRGMALQPFLSDVLRLKSMYKETGLFKIALRTLAKTYFIKDEVFVSHLMISPMRKRTDLNGYAQIGTSFRKSFINRPSFDIGTKKLTFDFSPRPWMLKIMRHGRGVRRLLPKWHKFEREIALSIRSELLAGPLDFQKLKRLDNVKGYRDVRYESAQVAKI